ncbi:aminoacyl-histidine dipeptidase [Draconibacterium sp. IB214405]|uniref:aminoacyl-histidine dipeptidase n=1 Tax=Draconibacterium sp. IB214405 TaxID=3097352 RepID=UPI002A0AB3C8|nr:aminoacyl-histidine dipeptidase [Draconibacterium sp. IB214405]MDX8341253.1 aminoacyl-histidine dipeptidase [Draconibacterium sp. IB214405]
MKTLEGLKPQPLFNYFEEICQVPRPSKKEEKIRQYLLDFAQKNKLEANTDKIGNVVIKKPASSGMEQAPTVILQTHMDMVCEKNSDKEFDFDNDAIEPMIVDGWVKANGTTLGADCGIGIAAQLAVLTSNELKHGPIECLITVDEETGLTGAFNLQPGFLAGSVLLNLDSEDEGELFIGCAGGIDTLATFDYQPEEVPENSISLKVSISGLLGGHSGDDIHKNRGNANKILNRFLWNWNQDLEIRLADFNGGNLRNAIAREAFGIITIPAGQKNEVLASFEKMAASIKDEFQYAEPKLEITCIETELPAYVVDTTSQNKLLNAVYACPHGVLEMSSRMEGMVETSTNLASVKFTDDNKIVVTTSQRSEIEGRKYYAAETVASVFNLAGAAIKHTDGYLGWTPNPDSDILKTTFDSYKKLFGIEPIVRSIHAGLECGLFLEKYPQLDMVSFGPTIRGAHSPDERLDISATEKFWQHLVDVLENIK